MHPHQFQKFNNTFLVPARIGQVVIVEEIFIRTLEIKPLFDCHASLKFVLVCLIVFSFPQQGLHNFDRWPLQGPFSRLRSCSILSSFALFVRLHKFGVFPCSKIINHNFSFRGPSPLMSCPKVIVDTSEFPTLLILP